MPSSSMAPPMVVLFPQDTIPVRFQFLNIILLLEDVS